MSLLGRLYSSSSSREKKLSYSIKCLLRLTRHSCPWNPSMGPHCPYDQIQAPWHGLLGSPWSVPRLYLKPHLCPLATSTLPAPDRLDDFQFNPYFMVPHFQALHIILPAWNTFHTTHLITLILPVQCLFHRQISASMPLPSGSLPWSWRG